MGPAISRSRSPAQRPGLSPAADREPDQGMLKIRNFEALISHGAADSRRVVLEIADKTLQRLDAYKQDQEHHAPGREFPAHRDTDLGPLEEAARLPRRRRKGMQRDGCGARRDPRPPPHQGDRDRQGRRGGRRLQEHGRLRGRTPAAQPDRLRGLPEDPGTRGRGGPGRPVHRGDQRGQLGSHELPGRGHLPAGRDGRDRRPAQVRRRHLRDQCDPAPHLADERRHAGQADPGLRCRADRLRHLRRGRQPADRRHRDPVPRLREHADRPRQDHAR